MALLSKHLLVTGPGAGRGLSLRCAGPIVASDAAACTKLLSSWPVLVEGDNCALDQCGGLRLGSKGAAELGPSYRPMEHGVHAPR